MPKPIKQLSNILRIRQKSAGITSSGKISNVQQIRFEGASPYSVFRQQSALRKCRPSVLSSLPVHVLTVAPSLIMLNDQLLSLLTCVKIPSYGECPTDSKYGIPYKLTESPGSTETTLYRIFHEEQSTTTEVFVQFLTYHKSISSQ